MSVEFDGDKDDEKSALGAQKKAVVQQLQLMDPTTGQPYVHDNVDRTSYFLDSNALCSKG